MHLQSGANRFVVFTSSDNSVVRTVYHWPLHTNFSSTPSDGIDLRIEQGELESIIEPDNNVQMIATSQDVCIREGRGKLTIDNKKYIAFRSSQSVNDCDGQIFSTLIFDVPLFGVTCGRAQIRK